LSEPYLSKMNRSLSSDSLDNENNEMIVSSGSSSPIDFTSDDENSVYNGLYMISGQPMNKIKKSPQTNKDKDKDFCSKFRSGTALNAAQNRNLGEQNRSITNLTNATNYIDHLGPSTSWLNYEPASQEGTGAPDTDQSLINQSWVRRPQVFTGSTYDSSYIRRELLQSRENIDHGGEKYVLYNKSPPLIESSAGGMNPITVRLCARLVECRTLSEAIEFIECDRDLIDNLTRIVTHEAPAYRNYDLSHYQIDNSVKESFNPNFWLDREPIVTTADGNCQYHAVSISLTGSEMYTPEVRLATAVAVVDNRDYFDSILKLIDRGTVLDLVHEIARCYSWGDETTLKAVAVAIKRRIFLYTCNIGKKDFEMVKSLTKEELVDAFKEKKYRGGTGIHTYADPLIHVSAGNYIMLFHKSEHFIAVLPTNQQLTMFEPYNPIVPILC
jgi:hypothetical protein